MQKLVRELIESKPGYLKKSPLYVTELLRIEPTYENVMAVKAEMKKIRKNEKGSNVFLNLKAVPYLSPEEITRIAVNHYIDNNDLKSAERAIKSIRFNTEKKSKVLVIGDIHEPFTLDGYLEFCKKQYDLFKCDTVVFIGDIIDNAFSSFYNINPDGFGAGEELDRAIYKISKWYETFPKATVIVGNHDRLAYRKAFAGGISARWIRDYNDVLGTQGWNFTESTEIDNVVYIHGEAGTARSKSKDTSKSTVQGHLHSQAYVEFINNRIFGMQVGTGVDDSQYAFNYNKAGKESILSCGVVLEGVQPFLIKM